MTRFRVVGVTAILLATVLVPAAPAHATVSTSYVGGVLTVTSDAASDVMVFTCESGSLRLNGAAIPDVAVCGQLKAKCPASELRCVGEAALSVTGKRRGPTRTVKLGDVLVVADGGRKDRISLVLTRAQRVALSGLTKTKLKIAYNVMDAAGNVGKGKARIPIKI